MSDLHKWHSRYGGTEWRVTASGIETRKDGVLRTAGEPISMQRYLEIWGGIIGRASEATGVPVEIILMTIATENGAAWVRDGKLGYPRARKEPGYISDEKTPHKISFGPCHILLSTARMVAGDPALKGSDLEDPEINIRLAAQYLVDLESEHGYDPILAAACYNAGGLYPAREGSRFYNRWHLRSWTGHLDRAARWYGDACAVLSERMPEPEIVQGAPSLPDPTPTMKLDMITLPLAERYTTRTPDPADIAHYLLDDLYSLYQDTREPIDGRIGLDSLTELWRVARDITTAVDHWAEKSEWAGEEKMQLAMEAAWAFIEWRGGADALRELIIGELSEKPLGAITSWIAGRLLSEANLRRIVQFVLELAVREIHEIAG